MDTIEAHGNDIGEIAGLMEILNRSTEKLGRSFQTIGVLQEEIAEKDRQIARKTRLEMLGRMAAGLAHEIRNPLGGIQLYASMLRRDLDTEPDKTRTIDRILSAVAGLETLVGDMLMYGRDLEPRRAPTALEPVVTGALDLARATLGEQDVTVESRLDGEATLEMDVEMMRRVFLNLILNAAQAMERGGTLTVTVEGRSVSFADTGAGIPAEVMDKLFAPFVTTKAKGTGLGLAIAQKIVEAHGGQIEAKNVPGGGAVFTVTL